MTEPDSWSSTLAPLPVTRPPGYWERQGAPDRGAYACPRRGCPFASTSLRTLVLHVRRHGQPEHAPLPRRGIIPPGEPGPPPWGVVAFADLTGVPSSVLSGWTSLGWLGEVPKLRRLRMYGPEHLERVRELEAMRAAGLTRAQMAELLAPEPEPVPAGAVIAGAGSVASVTAAARCLAIVSLS